MKNHYIRTAIVIEVLILLFTLIGTGFYTYVQAMDDIEFEMNRFTAYSVDGLTDIEGKTETETIYSFFDDTDFYYHLWSGAKDGFYSCLILDDGTIFDTSTEFYYVECFVETAGTSKSVGRRFFRLEEEYPSDILSSLTFDAECDDALIYDGSVTIDGETYQLRGFDYSASERMDVTSWAKSCSGGAAYSMPACKVSFGKDEDKFRLNTEAQDFLNDYLTGNLSFDVESEDMTVQTTEVKTVYRKNVFESYFIVEHDYGDAVYYRAYAWHPIADFTLPMNIHTYVFIGVSLVAIEVVIAFAMSKIYKNQKKYEIRSRRLARGIAHELKTPLAVTKAYIENWDYIDEEKRAEYTKTIKQEVADMSEQVDLLIEMGKIDRDDAKFVFEEIDIAELIREVFDGIRPLADERHLSVEMPSNEEKYILKADLRLMKIAIGNYLTNMLKYTDKTAKVKIRRSGRLGEIIRVSFENDSPNDGKAKTEKLNSNGMGVEINENIMEIHGFTYGSTMYYSQTIYWFEAKTF